MYKQIFGYLLILTSIFDAIKYSLQAAKIRHVRTAKAQSRKFINFAIINDIVKLGYGFVIYDFFIIVSSLLALFCMFDLWYTTYKYYPYKYRGLWNFRRPSIFLYLWNSLLPNRSRPKL
jgi:hypothetical protein